MAREAGDLVFTGEQEIMTVGVKDAEVLTKGRGVSYDASGFAQAETGSGTRAVGLHIALETKTGATDGVIKCQVAIGNTYVYGVSLTNTIKPNMLLKFSTGGKLTPHANPSNAAVTTTASMNTAIDAVRDYYGKAAARYIMMEGEERSASNPVTNSIIGVRLGVD
jgi:hypothetical protein